MRSNVSVASVLVLVLAPACGASEPSGPQGEGGGDTGETAESGPSEPDAQPDSTTTDTTLGSSSTQATTDTDPSDSLADSSSGDPTGSSTGETVEIRPRIVWYVASTHGAEGAWPPPSVGGTPQLDLSPVYGALADLAAPITFVTGVDNATLPGDPEIFNADAMSRLLTARPIQGGIANGPSIDQVIGARVEDPAPLGPTYFAGAGRADQQPSVYTRSGPRTPLGSPVDAYDLYAASVDDLDGFPEFPELDYDPADGAQIPFVLSFHFEMAAEVLRRQLNTSAVVQLGSTEAFYRPVWLGTDCGVNLLYHEMVSGPLGCEGAVWGDVLTWATGTVVELADALDARTVEDGSSLLDHTVIVWMQDYGTAGPHSLHDLPIVLIGGSALGFDGQHVLDADGYDQADLGLTLAALIGVNLESFGDPAHAAEIIPGLIP